MPLLVNGDAGSAVDVSNGWPDGTLEVACVETS